MSLVRVDIGEHLFCYVRESRENLVFGDLLLSILDGALVEKFDHFDKASYESVRVVRSIRGYEMTWVFPELGITCKDFWPGMKVANVFRWYGHVLRAVLSEEVTTHKVTGDLRHTFLSLSADQSRHFGIIIRNALRKAESEEFANKVLQPFQHLPEFNGKVNLTAVSVGID